MDRSQCTICQDLLLLQDTVGCPCGHTFHGECIAHWNRVNNNCPQCRKGFANAKPIKLYFDVPDKKDDELEPAELANKVQELKTQITQKDMDLKQKQEKIKAAKKELKFARSELDAVRSGLDQSETVNNALKRQLIYLEKHKEEAIKSKINAERLQKTLNNLETVKSLIHGERHEVENMIKRFSDSPDSLTQVVTSFVIIKKEFEKLKESKNKLNDDKKLQRKEIEDLRRKLQATNGERKALQDQLKLSETDLQHIEKERLNLQKKVHAMEQAFMSPSPRASAIKRLLQESPAPMAFKRARPSPTDELENSFSHDENKTQTSPPVLDAFESDDLKDLASEIGLKFVNTTSVRALSTKIPLGESKRLINTKVSTHAQSSNGFPVVQKGYNGLGGQTRFIKPSGTKKLSSKVKIPKSSANSKQIKHFMSTKNPPLPNFKLSPE